MYQLIIIRADRTREEYAFESFYDRDDYITEHWDDMSDWLVPCAFGGWIDIRDC